MSTTEASQPGGGTVQRIFLALVLFLFILGVVSFLFPRNKAAPVSPPVEEAPVTPGRNTTNLTVKELAARFNRFSSSMLGGRYLLPDDMKADVRNDVFHTYSAKFDVGYISIEADNKTGLPFSLAILGASSNDKESMELISMFASIGATMLGKGLQAGTLVHTCTKAAESEKSTSETQIGDFTVYCSNVMGAWMAGITVTKDKQIPSGKATVPMQPDAP